MGVDVLVAWKGEIKFVADPFCHLTSISVTTLLAPNLREKYSTDRDCGEQAV